MSKINRQVPIRDRAAVQLNIDRLNAVFKGEPLTQLDAVPDHGGSGYTLSPDATVLVVGRLTELQSHSRSPAAIAPVVRLACGFFKVAVPAPPADAPVVEEKVLTKDDIVEPTVFTKPFPVVRPSKKTKQLD